MASSTPDLIKQAIAGLQREVPQLAKLKLTFGLELRGRGDIQHFRVQLPGPDVSKSFGEDERLKVSIPRSHFNELAADGKARHWREAYDHGQIKVEGDPNVQRLIGKLVVQAEQRARLKKAR